MDIQYPTLPMPVLIAAGKNQIYEVKAKISAVVDQIDHMADRIAEICPARMRLAHQAPPPPSRMVVTGAAGFGSAS